MKKLIIAVTVFTILVLVIFAPRANSQGLDLQLDPGSVYGAVIEAVGAETASQGVPEVEMEVEIKNPPTGYSVWFKTIKTDPTN